MTAVDVDFDCTIGLRPGDSAAAAREFLGIEEGPTSATLEIGGVDRYVDVFVGDGLVVDRGEQMLDEQDGRSGHSGR